MAKTGSGLPLKEIELLSVLTENGGEVVTKNEILEKVWAIRIAKSDGLFANKK